MMAAGDPGADLWRSPQAGSCSALLSSARRVTIVGFSAVARSIGRPGRRVEGSDTQQSANEMSVMTGESYAVV